MIGGIDQTAELYIPKGFTKTFSNLFVKSDVGLTSVKPECAMAKIKAVPDFVPAVAKSAYYFKIQISDVTASGNCTIATTDLVNQTTSVGFVVTPSQ